MSEDEKIILETNEEMSEDDSSNLAQPPQTWSDLPVKIWENVLKNLSLEDFKNFNLTSKKFHEIADNYPNFQLTLTRENFIETDAEALRTSGKLYESVLIKFFTETCLNGHYSLLKEVFQRTGVFIKKLEIHRASMDRFLLLELLKLLPNLTSLQLICVGHGKPKEFSTKEEEEEEEAVYLPKLKFLRIAYARDLVNPISINIIQGCTIEELAFNSIPTAILEPYLQIRQQSIKKLTLYSNSSSIRYIDMLVNLKELKLESLELWSGRDDEKFLVFARNCPTLKHLMLWGHIVNDLVVNAICDNFNQLESLTLYQYSKITSNSSVNLHKLTNLKALKIIKLSYYGDIPFHPPSSSPSPFLK